MDQETKTKTKTTFPIIPVIIFSVILFLFFRNQDPYSYSSFFKTVTMTPEKLVYRNFTVKELKIRQVRNARLIDLVYTAEDPSFMKLSLSDHELEKDPWEKLESVLHEGSVMQIGITEELHKKTMITKIWTVSVDGRSVIDFKTRKSYHVKWDSISVEVAVFFFILIVCAFITTLALRKRG
jgi:hypothetical protein